jgi:hypothetical protein
MKIARNVIAGALSGIGVIVLLQQYAVLYPTGTIAILGIVVGIAVQFGVGAAFGRAPVRLATADPMVPSIDSYPGAIEPTSSAVDSSPTAEGWHPSHRVPAEGLATWVEPDPAQAPGPRLDPHLAVHVDETAGEWAHVVCENGWSAWVLASRLEAWQ